MRKTHPFEKRLLALPPEIITLITKIDECKGQWTAGANLSPQILGRLKKTVLVTSTGSSTRIEGSKLSDADIEKLLRGLNIQRLADRDKQEVRGYYSLLENVFTSWKRIAFSENTIKHFHGELLKYVKKDKQHRGDYKKRENKVHMVNKAGESVGVLFDTTDAYLTPKEMQELVEWTKEKISEGRYHPLLIIGHFLVEFLKIHPFQDGNGRLSRVLTNFLLLKSGYSFVPYVSHEKIIEENKPEYYLALRKSQKTMKTKKENIIPWLSFFLKIMQNQALNAIDLLSNENIEKTLSLKQLAVLNYLQKVDEASPKEISKSLKIARPTMNQIMNRLLLLKKVERIGLGRSTRYRTNS
jgi:Fic family protein